MANKDSHLGQAHHNEELARELANPPMKYKDWVITTCFYSAVHYLEAVWAQRGWHSDCHSDRRNFIRRFNYKDGRFLFIKYRKLEEACWLVRYLNPDIANNNQVAIDYYNENDILHFLNILQEIKKSVKIN